MAIAPDRADGYFWAAANMGALAESYGLRQGLKYRGAIKDALEQVVRIDPAFQRGSGYSALGRWYHMVPGLFGGSEARSEEYLRKALTYNPESVLARFYLAQTLSRSSRRQSRHLAIPTSIRKSGRCSHARRQSFPSGHAGVSDARRVYGARHSKLAASCGSPRPV